MWLAVITIELIFNTNCYQLISFKVSQVSKIHRAFTNGLTANIKLSKTQVSKIVQSGGILDTLLDNVVQGLLAGWVERVKEA